MRQFKSVPREVKEEMPYDSAMWNRRAHGTWSLVTPAAVSLVATLLIGCAVMSSHVPGEDAARTSDVIGSAGAAGEDVPLSAEETGTGGITGMGEVGRDVAIGGWTGQDGSAGTGGRGMDASAGGRGSGGTSGTGGIGLDGSAGTGGRGIDASAGAGAPGLDGSAGTGGRGVDASAGTGGFGMGGSATAGGGAKAGGSSGTGGIGTCSPSATPTQPLIADVQMPAAANYAVASFRLWYPKGVGSVRAVLVLLPSSNADGRDDVTDDDWQQFANDEKVALVGTFFQDQDTSAADELYAQAVLGSGQALLEAIARLGAATGRCELSTAPLLLWGFSAGGEFSFDFTCYAPQRVAAFVVNKGGYYHPQVPSTGAAAVPGLAFIGGQDEQFRINAINLLYMAGRGAGAPWALTVERTIAHDLGDSPALARLFFHAILPLRLPAQAGSPLRDIDQSSGYVGDLDALTVASASPIPSTKLARTAWLPDGATANLWTTVVKK